MTFPLPSQWLTWFLNSPSTLQMGLIILGLLLIAQGVIYGLQRAKPTFDFSELQLRVKSWWFMASFFLISLIIHPSTSLVLFAFLSFMALKEYFTLIHTRIEDHRALFWAFVTIPLQFYFIYINWWAMAIIFIPIYVFLFIPFRLILTGKTQGFIDSAARIQWGVIVCIYWISHMGFILNFPVTESITGGGKALLLYLVFLTEINDVAQYTFGKLFGKHKIAPRVSEKKTVEGFLGGVLTTTCLAVVLMFLSGFPLVFAIASGVLISCAGFIGDLVMSAVKRDTGVKDTGTLIPGHGGMLDRIDSLAYSAPLFFHFTNYFFFHVPW